MDESAILEKWEKYRRGKEISQKDKSEDGAIKASMVNEYIRKEIPFDEKPEVVKVFKNKFGENICSPDKIYSRIEIEILLLKHLQSGEDETIKNKREDLAYEFGYLSNSKFGNHLRELGYKHYLLGNKVGIDLRRGKNTYDHTIHPIFLTLNLKEVYFLTKILPKITDVLEKGTALDIAGDVYRQLSDYAKKKIDHFLSPEERENLMNRQKGYRTEDEEEFLYFLKSGTPCSLELKDKGWIYGIIKKSDKNYKIENTESGECVIFKAEDIMSGPLIGETKKSKNT